MRLGHLGKSAKITPGKRLISVGRLSVAALVTIALGIGSLIWRHGSPVVIGQDATLQVIETTPGLDWIGPRWRTVKTGEWSIVLPIIHHLHTMSRPMNSVTIQAKAQTSSGLEVLVKSLTISYEVPPNGAIDLIRHIGPQHTQLESFIRQVGVVTLRSQLAESLDATTGVLIDPDILEDTVARNISDTLADVGVDVRAVHLGGLRYEPRTEELIGRLRAARSRSQAAHNKVTAEHLRHTQQLEEIKSTGEALLRAAAAEFEPLIANAKTLSAQQMADADLKFQGRSRAVEIQQKTLRVRSEAWAYQARKQAEALTLRVTASTDLPDAFFVRELGQSIYAPDEPLRVRNQCEPAESAETHAESQSP